MIMRNLKALTAAVALFSFCGPLSANTNNNYDTNAFTYAKMNTESKGTVFLSFRDVEKLLHLHYSPEELKSLKALDYGCGAGRSTRLLKATGIQNTMGVDVNAEMLKNAREEDAEGHYQSIQSGKIPAEDGSMDIVLTSFVIVEISSKEELSKIFSDIHRVLKPGGLFVIVNASTEQFNPKNTWLSYKQDFPENYNAKSGDLVRAHIQEIDLVVEDYFWTDADINEQCQSNGFETVTLHKPLGLKSDGIEWKSEWNVSPYAVFLLRKKV